ncbi:MAG: tetratricopeptide repeat protein [Nitrospira sp.]|nr:tetratricopeptide repeat protein [Nitrospira sp.]
MAIWKAHITRSALLLVWLLAFAPDARAGVVLIFDPQGRFDLEETAEQAIQYANAYLKRQATAGSAGQELRLRGSSKDVLDALERQVQQVPTDLNLQTALGVTLFGVERRKEAQRHFEQVVHANPSYAIGHCYLAYVARHENDLSGVVKHFEQAIQADPTYVPAYNSLAMGYSAMGNNDAAFRVLAQGIVRFPDEASFLINQAYLYASEEQRWEAAEVSLRRAIIIQPTVHNRLLLGMILSKHQQYERAQTVFESILDTNPKNVMALVWLAGTYRDRHDHTKAIALIEQAIALEPANKDLHDELREHQEAYRNWKNQEKKE